MNGHVSADLSAYALEALSPDERASIDRHLQECPSCRDELYREMQLVVALRERPAEPVPPGLWDRIASDLPNGHRRMVRPAQLLAWAAVAAAFAVLVMWNLWLQFGSESNDDIASLAAQGNGTAFALAGTPGSPATGRLFLNSDSTQAGLVVSGLPPLAPEAGYRIWLVRRDQTRQSAGWFRVDELGQALVKVSLPSSLEGFTGAAITLDPEGAYSGATAPVGPDLLAGPLYIR